MRPYTRVISSDHTKTVEVDQVSNTIPDIDNGSRVTLDEVKTNMTADQLLDAMVRLAVKPHKKVILSKEWEGNELPFINPNEIENDSHLDEGSKE